MPTVDPNLMKLIAGGGGRGGIPAQPTDASPQTGAPPGGSPMSTPQPAQGEKQSAMVNVSIAMDLLEQTLGALGSESEEGQAVLQCLSGLSKKFGHSRAKSQELVPAELMQLFQSLPQAGGGMNPQAKAMGNAPQPQPGAQPMPMAA
jgi:hypothetical protein